MRIIKWLVLLFSLVLPMIEAYGIWLAHHQASLNKKTCRNKGFWEDEQICRKVDEEGFWVKKGLEVGYLVGTTVLLAICSHENWQDKYKGGWSYGSKIYYVVLVMFYASSRDMCLLTSRLLEYGFDYRIDIILCMVFLFRRYVTLFCQCMVLMEICKKYLHCFRLSKLQDCVKRLFSISAFILFEISCIIISSNFEEIISFLTSNIWIMMIQNSFWVYLLFYSLLTQERFRSTISIPKALYDIIYSLIFSFDITLAINYYYLTEKFSGNTYTQIKLIFLFLSINFLMLLGFIFHQVVFLGPYYPESLQNFKEYIYRLYPEFGSETFKEWKIPTCAYCMNSLTEPCVCYSPNNSQQFLSQNCNTAFCVASKIKGMKLYHIMSYYKEHYIKTPCGHYFHPECIAMWFSYHSFLCICGKAL
ncbi:unnamed protein product [Moneuplotes crassus]|uniref:RING-type domain-containing protein n=1 Tax=Euplotes crassus TaxID=5936 RepID=A0AAD1XDQ2_EUPCR|nr:unnamed protein product [Moneuplotes crassus]